MKRATVEERAIATRAVDGGSREIRFNLTLPVLRLNLGFFSIDPVEQLIGAKLSDILESLLTEPVYLRPSTAGPAIEVYPLALPEGEGASIPLGHFGDLGFANEKGYLVLTVPNAFAGWVTQRFGSAVVKGPVEGLSVGGTARVSRFAILIKTGMKAAIPMGALGEMGVEGG